MTVADLKHVETAVKGSRNNISSKAKNIGTCESPFRVTLLKLVHAMTIIQNQILFSGQMAIAKNHYPCSEFLCAYYCHFQTGSCLAVLLVNKEFCEIFYKNQLHLQLVLHVWTYWYVVLPFA